MDEEQEAFPLDLQKTQADIDKAKQEAKYMPLDYLIRATQASNTGSRFGAVYQYAKMLQTMTPEERANERANNPEAWEETISTLGNNISNKQSSPDQERLNKALKSYFPGNDEDMTIKPDQYNKVASAVKAVGGQKVISNNDKNLTDKQQDDRLNTVLSSAYPSFVPHPEEAKISAQNAANNAAITNQMKARKDSAVALESWFNKNRGDYAPRINNALDYAGGTGAVQLKIDTLKGLTGNAPKGYQDYRFVIDTLRPEIVNQIKMMEKMGATDSQREEMHGLLSAIDSISMDPKGARNLFNESIKSFYDLSDAVFDASEPYHKGVTRKLNNLPKLEENYLDYNPTISKDLYTKENIEATAKAYGISVQQVKEKLGIK
jgi:hypothetical protein